MTSAISFGLQGYHRGEAMLNTAAAQIAGAKPSSTRTADFSDLSSAAVSLIQGKNSGVANLASIHVADEMQKSTINMLG